MLIEAWNKLKEKYKETSVTTYTAFNTYKPAIKGDHTILITVDNVIQKETINEQKQEILSFLRQKLNNYAINIEIVLNESPKAHKAYLPAEKYQKMKEKNPDIERLKNDLDLDFIY